MSRLSESSLFQLVAMRTRLFFREPEAVFWIFIFPLLLALGLSLAFRNRPADVLQVAATTPQLTQALQADKGLSAVTIDEADGRKSLALGKVLLLAVQQPAAGNTNAPADGNRSVGTQQASVVYVYDDTNPDARTARLIAGDAIQHAAGRQEAVPTANRLVHEAGARYIDFVIPGLLGMNLMGSAIWGIGFSLVESRQKKLLKRMVASPMPRWQYLSSYLFSRLILLIVEIGIFLAFARFVFGVPFRGPVWQLVLLCVLVSVSFSALGLLLASRAKTMEAASGLMNLAMLPMWILSGVFFSAARFPRILQPFIQALPLTAAINALRGNMLQGLTLHQLLVPIAIVLTWMVVAFGVSLRIFRWR